MTSTKITATDASIILNLTPQQKTNLCRSHKLQAEKIGSAWILDKEVVEEYKSSNNCGATQDKNNLRGKELEEPMFKRPIAMSFFSGAMGLDLGIEKAGFEIVLTCETDKACRKTIVKNRPDIALIGNINDYSAKTIRQKAGLEDGDEIDLIVGGPPCQAFSTAGKRKGFNDERGNVLLTYLDRIVELRPRYAVIENVRGILSASLKHRPLDKRGDEYPPLETEELKGGALLFVLNKLKENGYGVSFNLYNAANFGTPQKRERVIIVASRDGEILPYLTPTHSENGEFGLPKWKSFKSAMENLPKEGLNHLSFPEKRLKYYRMLGPGEYWKHLPPQIQKKALGKTYYSGGGRTGFFRRLSWDRPSPTLVTHPAMPATDLAHPEENRPLSIEEYKRIQQFPDNWRLSGKLLDQYKQIGNAVPVGLGKAVGKLIMNQITGEKTVVYEGFKYSRYKNTNDVSWQKEVDKIYKKEKFEPAT